MVVKHSFQDVVDASARTGTLNLPRYKESVLKVEFGSYKKNITLYNGSEPPLPFSASEVVHTRIVDWRRLTADDKECKAIYEITFDLKGGSFSYQPGDTIGIIPKNNDDEVDFLLNQLDLTPVADLWYSLSIETSPNCNKTKIPIHIPISSTIRHVLTHYVDLRAVVKKLFLLALSKYTKNETERKVLEYLCSKEGSSSYITHILNTNTSLLDLLANLRSCTPPIEILFQYLPRLLPRPYSIINSPLKHPNVIKICFSVIDIGNNRKGLTTGWIENLILNKEHSLERAFGNLSVSDEIDNQTIPIYLRKNMNGFELPEKPAPVILIGPGTGVAPYIGFLEQMEYLRKECNWDKTSNIWLFFGCRHPNLDYIYQKELNSFVEAKVLSRLNTAFSRYKNCKTKYVQDAIMDNGEDIVKLIKDGSRIFVCGDVKTMAAQVKDKIVQCLVKYDNRTMEEAEKVVCDLQKDKLYVVDIWN